MTMPPAGRRREWLGFALGFLGVAIFSGSLPATRIAVTAFDPSLAALGRSVVAGIAAAAILLATRQRLPRRDEWRDLAIVAAGVIFGFPWLTAYAMRALPASHGAVVLGLLPLATAAAGALVAGDRPSRGFWIVAGLGSLAVVAFAVVRGAGRPEPGDFLLLAAVACAAIGYAMGGRLSRTLGGWQVICWALVLSLPVLIPPTLWLLPSLPDNASPTVWTAFLYTAVMSQLVGFFAWNAGLAMGGIARVSQTQLVQPFLTLLIAWWIGGEPWDGITVAFSLVVVALVALGRAMPVRRARVPY